MSGQFNQSLSQISQQLDDIQREKLQVLAELARLSRRRAYLQSAIQSEKPITLMPSEFFETSAMSYIGAPVFCYLQDRHGQSHQCLQCPDGLMKQLEGELVSDCLQAFNGAQPRFQSNVSGLGGILGPKLDFGSRVQTVRNTTRFIDEIQKPQFRGLAQKRDTDFDYTRVNFAQLRLRDEPWIVSMKAQKGVVPVTRVLSEEPLLSLQHQLTVIGTYLYDQIQVDEGFVMPQDMGGLATRPLAQVKAEREDLRKQCLQHRKQHRQKYSATRFAQDLEWVRSQQNPYAAKLLAESDGWKHNQRLFKKMFPLMERAVQNYGSWCLEAPPQPARPASKFDWEKYLLRGITAQ